MRKEDLDKRICDIEEGSSNTETFREYIRSTENEFNIFAAPIDSMEDEELSDYLEFLDDLWCK